MNFNDDDYIELDARIDGLRRAIASLVQVLPDKTPAVEALQRLQANMNVAPTHPATKEQVSQLLRLVDDVRPSGEAEEGDGERHGTPSKPRDPVSRESRAEGASGRDTIDAIP